LILSDAEIRAALRSGQIVISPPPAAENFTTSAVDLTLGREFKRWKKPPAGISVSIDPAEPSFSFQNVASQYLEPAVLEADGSVILVPREFVLGLTHETLNLPITSRFAARVEGRSSLARLGLGIHVTAPTIHAGFRGNVTLEITNHGTYPIRLRPGLRVCQLIFELVFGTPSADMVGVFQDQQTVVGAGLGSKPKAKPSTKK
jgi:dCTP deaminase